MDQTTVASIYLGSVGGSETYLRTLLMLLEYTTFSTKTPRVWGEVFSYKKLKNYFFPGSINHKKDCMSIISRGLRAESSENIYFDNSIIALYVTQFGLV